MAAAFVYPNVDPVPYLKRTAAIAQALDLGLEVVPTRGVDPRRARTDRARARRRDTSRNRSIRPIAPDDALRASLVALPNGRIAAKLANAAASVRPLHRRRGPDVSRRKSGAFALLADRRRSASRRLRQAHRLSRRSRRRRQDVRDARSRASAQGRRRRRGRRVSSKRTAEKRPPRCSTASKSFRREARDRQRHHLPRVRSRRAHRAAGRRSR